MTCEQVRDLLPEHLLGSLDETTDARVRRHLRGCTECRAERMRLEDGVAALSHATEHEAPTELRPRVLGVLTQEWKEPGGPPASPGDPAVSGRTWRWLAVAAAAVLLAVSLGWGTSQARQTARLRADASSYQALLAALGGKEFRLGTLNTMNGSGIAGTVVLYDGEPGRDWSSWGIVLAHAPGFEGDAQVTLVGGGGKSMQLQPLRFHGGEASSWLVTHEDLTGYDEVMITASDGTLLANARIVEA